MTDENFLSEAWQKQQAGQFARSLSKRRWILRVSVKESARFANFLPIAASIVYPDRKAGVTCLTFDPVTSLETSTKVNYPT